MDFAYLAAETFGDRSLERELLALFLPQARALVAAFPARDRLGRADAIHLLKGSARAVGATRVADAAEAYEAATTDAARRAILAELTEALACTETAIRARLSEG
jgi:HPt (histidine-containing phosphotransfer) domain-containing protein